MRNRMLSGAMLAAAAALLGPMIPVAPFKADDFAPRPGRKRRYKKPPQRANGDRKDKAFRIKGIRP